MEEMKEIVSSFYTKMSMKISLIKKMKQRELREMKKIMIDAKKQRKSAVESDKNSVFLSIEKPGNSPGQLMHYATAKSILQQSRQEWPSQSPAAAADTIGIDSACPSMTSDDLMWDNN